jgi:GT2 family glycosyltransferase
VNSSCLISVILTTYGRPEQVRQALEAVAAVEAPAGGFEVVVVDDGSPQPVDAIVSPFADRIPVRLVRQQNGGCAKARNTGAAASNGRYLVFLDDDCTPPPDWLTRIEAGFARHPEAMIGGRQENILTRNRFSAASQLMVDFLLETANGNREAGTYLNNIALSRAAFNAIGGFDERFAHAAEDRDLCDRWVAAGRRIIYDPSLIVYHAHHLTWRTYWVQHYRYGRGAACRWRKNTIGPRRPGYYLRLLAYPFRRCPLPEAVASLALLLVAQAATLWGFVREVRQR